MTNQISSPNITEPLEQISSVSTGKVKRPTWSASFGYDRKRQLEEERQKEMEAYKERKAATDPQQMRLLAMEMAIADLQKRVEELQGNAS